MFQIVTCPACRGEITTTGNCNTCRNVGRVGIVPLMHGEYTGETNIANANASASDLQVDASKMNTILNRNPFIG